MDFMIKVLEMLQGRFRYAHLDFSRFLQLTVNLQRCIFRRFPRNDVFARGIKME